MYTGGLGSGSKVVAPVVASVATPIILPNTGGNEIITIALALGAGLLTWGVMYARSGR